MHIKQINMSVLHINIIIVIQTKNINTIKLNNEKFAISQVITAL